MVRYIVYSCGDYDAYVSNCELYIDMILLKGNFFLCNSFLRKTFFFKKKPTQLLRKIKIRYISHTLRHSDTFFECL